MMQKHVVPGAVAALFAATGLAAAQQQPAPADTTAASSGGFSLSAGVDYSTGKYGGTTSTDFVYVPITGKYEIDRWIFKLTVPYKGAGANQKPPSKAPTKTAPTSGH